MTIDRKRRVQLERAAEGINRAYAVRTKEVCDAVEAGASYSEIAEALGLSKSAVAKIVNRERR